ncbi:MAG: zf-HC2 domain-containing protein [Acidobacteria bacterium]|nr:zf-HC2 domain-containing protein [Acidobacteriota bacterium]
MECKQVLKFLNEYIDDSLAWQEAEGIEQHLRACPGCAAELHQLRALQQVMRAVGRREPPVGLDLRMKILASKQTDAWMPLKAFTRLNEFLRPIAIPAVSGVVLTFLFFVPLLSIFFTGANLNASDKDIPSGIFTEPRPQLLYVTQFVQLENFRMVKEPITLEVEVRQDGSVCHYTVLKGPSDPATIKSLDQFLYFEVKIDPATLFGRPTQGKVVLSLSFYPTMNEKIDVIG